MRLNQKGFTLIELLAVVVILSVLMAIMVPSVNTIIRKNENDNYESLKSSIVSGAKMYFSDYRYEITVDGVCDSGGDSFKNISSIAGNSVNQINGVSVLPVAILVQAGNVKVNADGNIIHPREKNKKLNFDSSYVQVQYRCVGKDYVYTLEDSFLKWDEK